MPIRAERFEILDEELPWEAEVVAAGSESADSPISADLVAAADWDEPVDRIAAADRDEPMDRDAPPDRDALADIATSYSRARAARHRTRAKRRVGRLPRLAAAGGLAVVALALVAVVPDGADEGGRPPVQVKASLAGDRPAQLEPTIALSPKAPSQSRPVRPRRPQRRAGPAGRSPSKARKRHAARAKRDAPRKRRRAKATAPSSPEPDEAPPPAPAPAPAPAAAPTAAPAPPPPAAPAPPPSDEFGFEQ